MASEASVDELVAAITSPVIKGRIPAYLALGDRYEPEAGEALVRCLIAEKVPPVWWVATWRVLPTWLPLLDRRLSELPEWPFSGPQTLRLVEASGRSALRSAQPFVEGWLGHPEWVFRFAGFRWLVAAGEHARACDAARQLLRQLDVEFAVPDETIRDHVLMSAFNNKSQRQEELLRHLLAHEPGRALLGEGPRALEASITALKSPDPRARLQALVELRGRYEPEVGDALVAGLIQEQAPEVWWLAAESVLPNWLPLLDRRLAELPDWPFSPARTLRILELAGGRILRSAGRYVDDWLAQSGWELRFAAFRWLTGEQIGRAQEVAGRLFTEMHGPEEHQFMVTEQSAREGSWMREFDFEVTREAELVVYRETGTTLQFLRNVAK